MIVPPLGILNEWTSVCMIEPPLGILNERTSSACMIVPPLGIFHEALHEELLEEFPGNSARTRCMHSASTLDVNVHIKYALK